MPVARPPPDPTQPSRIGTARIGFFERLRIRRQRRDLNLCERCAEPLGQRIRVICWNACQETYFCAAGYAWHPTARCPGGGYHGVLAAPADPPLPARPATPQAPAPAKDHPSPHTTECCPRPPAYRNDCCQHLLDTIHGRLDTLKRHGAGNDLVSIAEVRWILDDHRRQL